jgi:SAM-dependent methyltransferase
MNIKSKAEDFFDDTAGVYDDGLKDILGLSEDFDTSIFAEYKVEILKNITESPLSILEFGCGTGRNIPFLRKYFPQSKIYGCDVSAASLAEAAKREIPETFFQKIDTPEQLTVQYKDIDVIFTTNVFHHIPFEEHAEWMNALRNIIKKSDKGVLVMFEHNPLNPVIFMKLYKEFHGENKWGESMLQPGYSKKLAKRAGFKNSRIFYTLFFLKRSSLIAKIENALSWLPFGAQYCLVARTK